MDLANSFDCAIFVSIFNTSAANFVRHHAVSRSTRGQCLYKLILSPKR